VATEIKNFKTPASEISDVIMSVADFVEDRKEGEGNTWNTAKSKMYEFVRRGVGIQECVTDEQMETLRKFA